jgi:hypothetical protein
MKKIRVSVLAAASAGALVATVFAAQSWTAGAAPGDSDSTFVPITPCRLSDTRPEFKVNTQTAFTAGQSQTYAAHGTNGNCTLPVEAVGLSLNVTALNATAPTFVTVWPEGTLPVTSSLNQVPGQTPTPNAVTIKLAADGSFMAYNLDGTLDVIVDVTGYYTGSSLEELDTRVSAVAADVEALQAAQYLEPFMIRIDIGETETIVENGALSLEATCVDNGGGDTEAIILAATTTDDFVLMDGNDDFTGDPDFLLPTTLADDREMFTNDSTTTYVDNDIDEGFVMNGSGEYIGLDGETLALGVNYGATDCVFAGTTTAFTAAG